jgi:hypothetical protein
MSHPDIDAEPPAASPQACLQRPCLGAGQVQQRRTSADQAIALANIIHQALRCGTSAAYMLEVGPHVIEAVWTAVRHEQDAGGLGGR